MERYSLFDFLIRAIEKIERPSRAVHGDSALKTKLNLLGGHSDEKIF